MPNEYVRGRRLGYGVQPMDFAKSSLAILFIHGTGGDREDWEAQLEGLSSYAAAIALELPGHGTSEGPGATSVKANADWVVDFIEAMGLAKVFLIGCSLGSAITQWIALSPQRWLVGIGLVGAGARLKVHPDFLDGLLQGEKKALSMLAEACLSPAANDSLRERMRQKFLNANPDIIHADLSACIEFDIVNQIQQIKLPTWIIVGQDDKLTPPKYSNFLRNGIQGSKLTVVPDAGHLVMMEKPAEFNSQLLGFLLAHDLL